MAADPAVYVPWFHKSNCNTLALALTLTATLTPTPTLTLTPTLTRFHKSNYNTTGGADRSSNGGRRVADTLMLVPAARMRAFAHFLSSVPYAPTWTQFSLHEIADPIDGIEGGNVRGTPRCTRTSQPTQPPNVYTLVQCVHDACTARRRCARSMRRAASPTRPRDGTRCTRWPAAT